MDTKPRQDLSLLPGGYYHPEAELLEIGDTNDNCRYHVVPVEDDPDTWTEHGIEEWYDDDGVLTYRLYYFHGQNHGPSEEYYDGTLVKSGFWYKDKYVEIFPSLLLAATGLPHFPFIK